MICRYSLVLQLSLEYHGTGMSVLYHYVPLYTLVKTGTVVKFKTQRTYIVVTVPNTKLNSHCERR
jgi:hypothetical protein